MEVIGESVQYEEQENSHAALKWNTSGHRVIRKPGEEQ